VNEIHRNSSPQTYPLFLSRNRRVGRWWCESTIAVVHNGWNKSFSNAGDEPAKDTPTLKSMRFYDIS